LPPNQHGANKRSDETCGRQKRIYEGRTEKAVAFQEKNLLQGILALAAATPVLVGLEGLISGPSFLRIEEWPVDLDSHFRFYSGIFLALGLAWYSCIPDIEHNTARFRLLGVLTISGGLARLVSFIAVGPPSTGHQLGLFMELIVVPLLMLWQARIARKSEAALVAGV